MMTHSGQTLLSDTESTANSEEEQKCISIQYSVKHIVILLVYVRDPGDWGHVSSPSYPDRE